MTPLSVTIVMPDGTIMVATTFTPVTPPAAVETVEIDEIKSDGSSTKFTPTE